MIKTLDNCIYLYHTKHTCHIYVHFWAFMPYHQLIAPKKKSRLGATAWRDCSMDSVARRTASRGRSWKVVVLNSSVDPLQNHLVVSTIYQTVFFCSSICPCHSTSISIPSCMAIAAATFCRANACHEMPQSQSSKAKGDNCQKRGTGLPRPVSNFLGHHQLLTDYALMVQWGTLSK